MREIINIFIGQCGIQMGYPIWDLLCQEHQINLNGNKIQQGLNTFEEESQYIHSFFNENLNQKLTPRSIFVDLDQQIIDDLNQSNLISGKEDASNVFSRGAYSYHSKDVLYDTLDSIRKQTENCDNFQGFMIYNSLCGGTGSGFNSELTYRLTDEIQEKCQKVQLSVAPSRRISSNIVESYNFLHSSYQLLNSIDLCILFTNEAMYNICSNKLDIDNPSYSDLNKLIAQVVSSLTSSIRFKGNFNLNLTELITNLVPFPKTKLALASYSVPSNSDLYLKNRITVPQITNLIFSKDYFYADCNPKIAKYLSCSYILRGQVFPTDIYKSINILKQKKTVRFVDWCPTGFKVGINEQQPKSLLQIQKDKIDLDGCLISNSSAVLDILNQIYGKFEKLYQKRAFVHWYVGEGMEGREFHEAEQNLEYLIKEYQEATKE